MHLPSTPAWTSETLELFLLQPEHVSPAYVGWLNDAHINRFLESRFAVHTEDSTRAFVDGCLGNPDVLFLGVRHLEMRRHVGNVKLELNRRHGTAEVGILIGDSAVQGQGVATQTIRMLKDIARNQLALRKLTAGCYASNKGSERAFVKAGFALEGLRPAHFLLDGKPEAFTLMGCLL